MSKFLISQYPKSPYDLPYVSPHVLVQFLYHSVFEPDPEPVMKIF